MHIKSGWTDTASEVSDWKALFLTILWAFSTMNDKRSRSLHRYREYLGTTDEVVKQLTSTDCRCREISDGTGSSTDRRGACAAVCSSTCWQRGDGRSDERIGDWRRPRRRVVFFEQHGQTVNSARHCTPRRQLNSWSLFINNGRWPMMTGISPHVAVHRVDDVTLRVACCERRVCSPARQAELSDP